MVRVSLNQLTEEGRDEKNDGSFESESLESEDEHSENEDLSEGKVENSLNSVLTESTIFRR